MEMKMEMEMKTKKWVLFGAGVEGKRCLEYFGDENVAFFIDSYKSGQSYCGKPVVSLDDFLKENPDDYSIGVTLAQQKDEVIRLLEERGIHNYTVLGSLSALRVYQRNGQFLTKTEEDFIRHYRLERFDSLLLYGANRFSLRFLRLLAVFGNKITFCAKLVAGCSAECIKEIEEELFQNVEIIHELPQDLNAFACIIVDAACDADGGLRERLFDEDYGGCIVDMCRADLLDEACFHPELERFKGKYAGRRCFIIGNGPSLRMSDLDTLWQRGEICFASNRISSSFNETAWRPTYYCWEEFAKWHEWLSAMLQYRDEIEGFFTPDYFEIDEFMALYNGKLNVVNFVGRHFTPYRPAFAGDLRFGYHWGNTVAYFMIQLAAYMGFSEIYLLGVDNTLLKPGAHFYGSKFIEAPLTDNIRLYGMQWVNLAYESALRYSQKHGFHIYNATRGGELETFKRVDFGALF